MVLLPLLLILAVLLICASVILLDWGVPAQSPQPRRVRRRSSQRT